jgi:hypothetical protein
MNLLFVICHLLWGDEKTSDFSRYLENLSLNLSPTRRETLNFPPSRVGKGARGLGLSWGFTPHIPHPNCHRGVFTAF